VRSEILELSSDRLALMMDASCGAEILSLRDRRRDLELLVRTPWRSSPATSPASELQWTRRWRGGWQLLLPNAGNECLVEGRRHGFHGEASLSWWELLDRSAAHARLRWRGADGLVAVRDIDIRGPSVAVATEITNGSESAQPIVMVEHLILGPPLAGPGTRIDAPPAILVTLDPVSGARVAPPGRWPLGPGGVDWSSRTGDSFTCFGALEQPEPRTVRVREAAGDAAVAISWSGEALPHLWFWHEHRAARLVDDHHLTCLGIEPASTTVSTGLARAIAQRQAIELNPGATTKVSVSLALLD
jgi:hypothetical protein